MKEVQIDPPLQKATLTSTQKPLKNTFVIMAAYIIYKIVYLTIYFLKKSLSICHIKQGHFS